MTNFQTGHDAEKVAAEYLKEHGFKVKTLNWRTRYCEIDIIAEKARTMFFIEVKSRKNTIQGSGLEYITNKKIRQMSFAAEMWVSENNWNGDYQLAALAIDADDITYLTDL